MLSWTCILKKKIVKWNIHNFVLIIDNIHLIIINKLKILNLKS